MIKTQDKLMCLKCGVTPKDFLLLDCNHIACVACCLALESMRDHGSIIRCHCGRETFFPEEQQPSPSSATTLKEQLKTTVASSHVVMRHPSSAKQASNTKKTNNNEIHMAKQQHQSNKTSNRPPSSNKQRYISSFQVYQPSTIASTSMQQQSQDIDHHNRTNFQEQVVPPQRTRLYARRLKTDLSEVDNDRVGLKMGNNQLMHQQNYQTTKGKTSGIITSMSANLKKELEYAEVQFRKTIDQLHDAFNRQLRRFQESFDEYKQNLRVWYVELSAVEADTLINIPRFLKQKYSKISSTLESFLTQIFDFASNTSNKCDSCLHQRSNSQSSGMGARLNSPKMGGFTPSYLSPKPSYLKHTSQLTLVSPIVHTSTNPQIQLLRKRRLANDSSFVEELIAQRRAYDRKKSGIMQRFR